MAYQQRKGSQQCEPLPFLPLRRKCAGAFGRDGAPCTGALRARRDVIRGYATRRGLPVTTPVVRGFHDAASRLRLTRTPCADTHDAWLEGRSPHRH